MHPTEIEECLKTMVILVDTREHRTKEAFKRYKSFNCPYRFEKLDFCDYSVAFRKDDIEYRINVGIERKASLEELSGNLIQEKKRFEREFQRGSEAQGRMYLLVEEGNTEKMYAGKYRTRVHPNAYTSSLWAIVARYHLQGPIFCKKELSGRIIHDILYRELKCSLERGDWD